MSFPIGSFFTIQSNLFPKFVRRFSPPSFLPFILPHQSFCGSFSGEAANWLDVWEYFCYKCWQSVANFVRKGTSEN
jgi:hypothetical protein